MATVREIQNLLSKVELTIDEDDIGDAIEDLNKESFFRRGGNIEEILIKNAQYISFKKLLMIIVQRRQELLNEFKAQKISPLIEKQNEEQLRKAINFAKSYIKPEEFVKVETKDYALGRERIIDSKTVIYGEKIEEENKLYEKIKDVLPDIEVCYSLGLFITVLEDKKMAEQQLRKEIKDFMKKEGMEKEVIDTFWKKYPKARTEEELREVFQIINKERFNKRIRALFESWGPYVNVEKCILFYGGCIEAGLERRKRIR